MESSSRQLPDVNLVLFKRQGRVISLVDLGFFTDLHPWCFFHCRTRTQTARSPFNANLWPDWYSPISRRLITLRVNLAGDFSERNRAHDGQSTSLLLFYDTGRQSRTSTSLPAIPQIEIPTWETRPRRGRLEALINFARSEISFWKSEKKKSGFSARNRSTQGPMFAILSSSSFRPPRLTIWSGQNTRRYVTQSSRPCRVWRRNSSLLDYLSHLVPVLRHNLYKARGHELELRGSRYAPRKKVNRPIHQAISCRRTDLLKGRPVHVSLPATK